MGRPTKANSLTPDDVIAAAIACIDAEGPAALGVSRVARQLGISPPAIYRHLPDHAGLQRAVALRLWQQYLDYCHQRLDSIEDDRDRLLMGWRVTRQFAQQYPARYQVMTAFRLQPEDNEANAVIQEARQFIADALHLYGLSDDRLSDAMRMITATLNGFIAYEQRGNFTLSRSTGASFEVILEALMVAVEYIREH
ncbi:MAG: TetR/AcrR family transcriptional regulator [Cyanobacteria bacterium P01_A01_bin.135]